MTWYWKLMLRIEKEIDPHGELPAGERARKVELTIQLQEATKGLRAAKAWRERHGLDSSAKDPAIRSRIGRIAWLTRALQHTGRQITEAGRAAVKAHWEKVADPDGTVEPRDRERAGKRLLRQHMKKLNRAAKSKRKRRDAKAAGTRKNSTEIWNDVPNEQRDSGGP